MPYTLQCTGCRTVGAVNKITAALRCTCGGQLDVYEPGAMTFHQAMGITPPLDSGGTGWEKPLPDPLDGWAVQQPGNMPGFNPMGNHVQDAGTCPVCKGSGKDILDNRNNGICRECKGTGRHDSPTEKMDAPQVARHDYPNNATSVPFFGSLWLPGAACPNRRCKTAGTQLLADRHGHAWWHCAASCGPLADLDVQAGIDPYAPPRGFTAQRGFREATRAAHFQRTGKIIPMIASTMQANPGLTPREALTLVRRAVEKYSER